MSAQEVFVQQFARLFHHYDEALDSSANLTAEVCRTSWNGVPFEERSRLVGAARLALLELETDSELEGDARRYFAKPGEAEWGC